MEKAPRAGYVHFGAYRLDLAAGELYKGRTRLFLPEQPFQILCLLLEHPGQVVTREEIRQKLWPHDTVVDFDHGINTAVRRLRDFLNDRAGKPRYIETLPRRGYRWIAEADVRSNNDEHVTPIARKGLPRLPKKIDTIAVLPFENSNGDPEADYLAEGIPERLISSLSQLRRLRVIPRSTAFRFRAREKNLQDVARELNAQTVLSGRVLVRGEELVVSAELVDVSRQAQIWGGRYSRKVTDLFAVEEDLATEIAASLRLQLSPGERQQLRKRGTRSREAYQLFLKAQYHIHRWTPHGMMRGLEYCRQAIETDPAYAAPHALIGLAYEQMGHGGVLTPREAFPLAKISAARALELDEEDVEAHLVLAMVQLYYDWDWSGAEGEYRRALVLAPNYARTHQAYANWLMATGKLDEAIARVNKALSLDPLVPEAHFHLGLLFYYRAQHERSLTALARAIELDPQAPLAPLLTSWILAETGRYEEAIPICERFLAYGGGASGSRAYLAWTLMWKAHLAWAYAHAGLRERAEDVLENLQAALGEGYAASAFAAAVYCFLGETDSCLRLLERAVEDRIGCLILLDRNPVYERLRGNSRFENIRRCIGLPAPTAARASA